MKEWWYWAAVLAVALGGCREYERLVPLIDVDVSANSDAHASSDSGSSTGADAGHGSNTGSDGHQGSGSDTDQPCADHDHADAWVNVQVKVAVDPDSALSDGPLEIAAGPYGEGQVVVSWRSEGVERLEGDGAWSGVKTGLVGRQSLTLPVGSHVVVLNGYVHGQVVSSDSVTVVVGSHSEY